MIYGCLKIINETLSKTEFKYDVEKIFESLLSKFVFNQQNGKQLCDKTSLVFITKTKLKQKKLLYDVIKRMIYDNKNLLEIFVSFITPKLQHAEWRRNTLSSWALEQQKKEKKYFCGLQNLAATCYINCLFQQLFMIKIFSDKFINVDSLAYKQSVE